MMKRVGSVLSEELRVVSVPPVHQTTLVVYMHAHTPKCVKVCMCDIFELKFTR